MSLHPVISQRTYPGVGDVDDCAVIATFWAARAAGFGGTLPTVTEFRAAANRPDSGPGSHGLTNAEVWAGVSGTVLGDLHPERAAGPWAPFASAVRAGAIASVALDSSKLPSSLRFGFMGAHRVGLAWLDGRWFLANPLAAGGSAPLSIAEDTLIVAIGSPVEAVTFPAVEDGMVTVTITRFPAPVTFRIAAGATVHGFRPDSPRPVKVGTFVTASSAQADGMAVIVQSPDPLVVPHGTFVRACTGVYAGMFVPAGEVTLDPIVPVDVKHTAVLSVDGVVRWTGDI